MVPVVPDPEAARASRFLQALGLAAAAVDHMVIVVSAKDGKIVACNAGAPAVFGYAECELVGRSMLHLQQQCFHPDRHDVYPSRPDVGSMDGPQRYLSKSGRRIRGETQIVALDHLDAGAYAWFIRDITSRYEALPARVHPCPQEAAASAHVDRTDEHGLALISHELKQPLTALMIQLEGLIDMADAAGIPAMADRGRAIRSTVRRQARLIDDLFEFSRARTGKLKLNLDLVDLDHIIRAICAEVALAAPTHQLNVDMDRHGTRLCMGDAARLEQIFSNLLHNAVKFSEAGGRIDVCVTSVDGFAKISIADDGLGISAEFLPKVFHMFGQERRTAHSVNAGLGIGLALVRELTTAHGGSVEVHSNGPGRGARFTVQLPLADRSALPRSAPWGHACPHSAMNASETARA
jgi:two-component system CheB/CheR fusion protein